MDSSDRKGMSCIPNPMTLILNEEEQGLINKILENMNNQLTQMNSELKPRVIAIDISRLQNAMMTLLQQVVVIQRTISSAAWKAYQNEMGNVFSRDPNEAPPFMDDEPIELDILSDPDEFITAYDAAAILKITLKTLYKKLKDKSLPGRKILGKWYIKKDIINNMLNGKSSERELCKKDE